MEKISKEEWTEFHELRNKLRYKLWNLPSILNITEGKALEQTHKFSNYCDKEINKLKNKWKKKNN